MSPTGEKLIEPNDYIDPKKTTSETNTELTDIERTFYKLLEEYKQLEAFLKTETSIMVQEVILERLEDSKKSLEADLQICLELEKIEEMVSSAHSELQYLRQKRKGLCIFALKRKKELDAQISAAEMEKARLAELAEGLRKKVSFPSADIRKELDNTVIKLENCREKLHKIKSSVERLEWLKTVLAAKEYRHFVTLHFETEAEDGSSLRVISLKK